MKKITIMLITTILLCVLLSFAAVVNYKRNVDFNIDDKQYNYNFVNSFLEATEEIRGMYFLDAMEYMAELELEHQIVQLHEIIDERILSLREWEIKFNTVYSEPYLEIDSIISLEYAYRLSKIGFHVDVEIDSEEWYFLGSLFVSIKSSAYSPEQRDMWKIYADVDKPHILTGFIRDDHLLRDDDIWTWLRLEKKANAYINDSNISEEDKKWVRDYMQRDPQGEYRRKLKEKGLWLSDLVGRW